MRLYIYKTNLIFILFAAITFTGCKKFLAEDSQDLQYAGTAQKLDELLVGEGYEKHASSSSSIGFTSFEASMYFPWLNVMDDDVTEFVTGFDTNSWGFDSRREIFGFYTWQRNPFVSESFVPYPDDMWKKVYAHINAVNIIADKASELSDNPEALKRIRGEALFLRAGYYFDLVNIYAGAYHKTTAAKDPGVPLKTTSYVEDHYFTRSTVDSVYLQMVADLKEAETALTGITQKTIYHADINAVNLLQSRVYLYMEDYANASAAADKVISRKGTLYNLATYKTKTSFLSSASPEAIFTQGSNAMLYITSEGATETLRPSDELMNLFQNGDLRKSAFFELDQAGKYRYIKVYKSVAMAISPTETYSDNFFLRNAEAYLNKAEAEAMLNNAAAANLALNTLRQARFMPADYTPINLNGAELVNFIRDERRRELCFEGDRWFDLKRYAVNTAYPFSKTIVHPYSFVPDYGKAPILKATLQLAPLDAAYLIPIPGYAVEFNQGLLKQNPDRPDRQF